MQPSIEAFVACLENAPTIPEYRAADGVGDLRAEWNRCLSNGPGIFIIRGAFADLGVVHAMTDLFRSIISSEQGGAGSDHFAAAGASTRIWNVLQKTAVLDPRVHVGYYANPFVAMAAESWLGPGYQMTAQVNVVHPGGAAQYPHRDYHLGFQTDDVARLFPPQAHALSVSLTLQGMIAHTDMSVESGPTMVLPYSQRYPLGYLAWRDPAFAEVFAQRYVQLPLDAGDAVFFNPALHHAAGTNHTNADRIGNLLQVSSPFGKPMEAVDTYGITAAVYEALLELKDPELVRCAVAASADGYSFPTNIDTDPPSAGLAPETAQALTLRAVADRWPVGRFRAELSAHQRRRQPTPTFATD